MATLAIGDRVKIVSRKHPWAGERGTVTQPPTPTRFLGQGEYRDYIEIEVDNSGGTVCGAKPSDVRKLRDS